MYFARSYSEAREKFRTAATRSGFSLACVRHPSYGAFEEQLYVDVATKGDEAPAKIITISGIHGVEGYAGSALQCALMERWDRHAPIGAVFIHAANPWGMSWCRRECEDNVDLFRNLNGFDKRFENKSYNELHDALLPASISGRVRDEADEKIKRFISTHGEAAFWTAVRRGQYDHPDGLMFHGCRPTWARDNLIKAVASRIAECGRVFVFDIHTGFGEFGDCAPISVFDEKSRSSRLLKEVYGDELLIAGFDPRIPRQVDPPYQAIYDTNPSAEFLAIGIEFGVYPPDMESFELWRWDTWYHTKGDALSGRAQKLRRRAYEYDCPDTAEWKTDVVEKGALAFDKGMRWLQ